MDRETLAASVTGTAAQLRLQLANLTAASQMLERAAEDPRAKAYLAVLNQNICRMLRTVGQMELLARLTDEDEIRAFPVMTDLGPWMQELVQRIQGVLRGAGISLEYQGPELLMANVDPQLIQQMVLELLAAAAQPEAPLSLTLSRQGDSACFTVRGAAPQLSAGELAHLLGGEEGFLPQRWDIPLAQRIAELHGGSLVAETGGDHRVTLVATLPLGMSRPTSALESPSCGYHAGGFDQALVAFSELLPQALFSPENLG